MKNQTKIIIACLFLTPLMCLGLDLYTPSLPAITDYFHVSAFATKLTIVFYLVGFVFANAISQIVERYTTIAGTASGLMSGLLNMAAAIIVYICSAFLNLHYLLILSAVYFVLLLCSICVFYFLRN